MARKWVAGALMAMALIGGSGAEKTAEAASTGRAACTATMELR